MSPWSVRWLSWRARHGSASALVSLGHVCEAQGGDAGINRANTLYRQAAELGNSQAMWNLGVNYLGKKGGDADPARGIEWLRTACEREHPLAMWALGKMHLAGRMVEQDPDRGLALLTRSAELGCESACLAVSDIYRRGNHGVDPDPEAANRWYLRSLPFRERLWIRLGLKRVQAPGAS